MALEVLADLLEGAGRIVAKLTNDVLIEFICKGTGYFICKCFKQRINPDGLTAFIVGFGFWLVVVVSGFYLYAFIQHQS